MIDELDYELPRYYVNPRGVFFYVMDRTLNTPVLGERSQPRAFRQSEEAERLAKTMNERPTTPNIHCF